MIKRWCRWGWEIPLHIARRLQAPSSMRPAALLPPVDRHVRYPAKSPAWRATALFALPKWKKEELECIPHGWHSIHCTVYLASFLTLFILCSIALASVKLAERYSRKRYLSTHTVGRKWKSPSWTRTSLFVCLLRHGRKVDQMLGVYLSANALFGTGN